MNCTKKCDELRATGDDEHWFCECHCHVGSLPAILLSREHRAVKFVSTECGHGAWALFYLERLVNYGVLDRAKQRGEFVPHYEKIKTLVQERERKLR